MTKARPRALLVEDSPTQAEQMRALLESEGVDVLYVDSAEAALALCNWTGIDLIVIDYHLPGMNGHDFCGQIRMNVSTRAIPVLMLTVEDGDAAQLLALERGADDYLTKGADPEVLRVRVRSLLRKSPGATPILEVEKRFSRARLLVIDDSPTYLARVAAGLRAEHYIVDTAGSAAEGFAMMSTSHYDCLLIDFEMSGGDGPEVCRKVLQMQPESASPPVLIILTSHTGKEHMIQSLLAGADDFITKSSHPDVIKARVRALLRRKFLVDENRKILNQIKEKELQALRAQAEKECAEVRAQAADQLALANRELERANNKLSQINQELERFAYAAAHDLKEPLRMISIYCELLQTRYGAGLDLGAAECLTHCLQGARRMDQLVKDLLDYARATQADHRDMEFIDCNQVLNGVLADLEVAIQESKAEIVRGELPTLYFRRIQMQQLMQNLVGNALKYRRKEMPPRVHITAERGATEWLFVVQDNGIGIEPEQQAAVFTPFKRLHPERSGTGLGLSMCQRVVEHYGGRIWIESVPGSGCTFYFTLPAHLEQPAKTAAMPEPQTGASSVPSA